MITEFSLFVFTTLAGLTAGTYFMSAIFAGTKISERPWMFNIVMLVLLGGGLLGALLHLGRPERFLNGLLNPFAPIAQESYWAILLGTIVFVEGLLLWTDKTPPRLLRIAGAVAGFALMLAMTFVYQMSYGNPAWTSMATFPFFVVGNLAMGAAFWALFNNSLYQVKGFVLTSSVLCTLLAATLLAEVAVFSDSGYSTTPFVIGAVLVVASGVVAGCVWKSGTTRLIGPLLALLLTLSGLLITRYAFYAASVV